MPTLLPIRALLGLFAIFFAYYFGRAVAAKWGGVGSTGRLARWGGRLFVTVFGILYPARDWLAALLIGLAALSAGLGFYAESRPAGHDGAPPRITPLGE